MLNSEIKQGVPAEINNESSEDIKKLISLYKNLNDKCDAVINKIKNKNLKK